MSLTASIKSIQDIMRKDVGVDGDAQRISHWLLLLKFFGAREEEMETTRDDYRSPLPQKLRWRNWATDPEGITGDQLQKFVNDQLFPGLKELKGATFCIADIAARGYNLDVKNPNVVDDARRDHAELLAECQKAQAAVAEVREKLRKGLEDALLPK
jgi:type I restriction enzyme M protein